MKLDVDSTMFVSLPAANAQGIRGGRWGRVSTEGVAFAVGITFTDVPDVRPRVRTSGNDTTVRGSE